MKTLAQFKREQDIQSIDLLQGKGRKYASVRDLDLVVSSKCDLTKPLFVIPMSEEIEEGKGFIEGNTRKVENVYLLVNGNNVKVVQAI